MDASALSPDAKRRRVEITATLPKAMSLRCQALAPAPRVLSYCATRCFVLLIQDPTVSVRTHALAAQALVHALSAAGASSDCDGDAAAIAADWLHGILNTKAFFMSHWQLILQVRANCYVCSSAPRLTLPHAGSALVRRAPPLAFCPRSSAPPPCNIP